MLVLNNKGGGSTRWDDDERGPEKGEKGDEAGRDELEDDNADNDKSPNTARVVVVVYIYILYIYTCAWIQATCAFTN